jgi:2-methylaconitate cis-trans-isomerase PrpF
VDVDVTRQPPIVRAAGVVRTARKLFDGLAFASNPPPDDHR